MWVVDAVFARLCVCVFVVLLWCCVWFVPFCSVLLIGLGLFWGLARVVLFCCVGVAVLFCLIVGLFVGWSVHWLVGCALVFYLCLCCVAVFTGADGYRESATPEQRTIVFHTLHVAEKREQLAYFELAYVNALNCSAQVQLRPQAYQWPLDALR